MVLDLLRRTLTRYKRKLLDRNGQVGSVPAQAMSARAQKLKKNLFCLALYAFFRILFLLQSRVYVIKFNVRDGNQERESSHG